VIEILNSAASVLSKMPVVIHYFLQNRKNSFDHAIVASDEQQSSYLHG
jgi:hypothetical protein